MKSESLRVKARIVGNQKAYAFYSAHRINSCELQYEGCVGKFSIAIAHDSKGRNLSIEELAEPDMERQCLACTNCHRVIEYEMSEEEMQKIVQQTARERNERLMGKSTPKQTPDTKKKPEKKNYICKNCGWNAGKMAICRNCGALQG